MYINAPKGKQPVNFGDPWAKVCTLLSPFLLTSVAIFPLITILAAKVCELHISCKYT